MSRWRPELGATVTVLGCSAAALSGPAAGVDAPAAGWDEPALLAAFDALAAGAAMRVLVAPDLCRHFMLAPVAGVQSLGELRELAGLRATQLFGTQAAGWVVVADWRLDAASACAAMPQPLLQALQQAAGQRRLGVQSAVLVALERLLAGPAATGHLGFATPGHAVLAGLQGGQLVGLHVARRNESAGAEALAAQLARDAARESLLGGPQADVALAWTGPPPLPLPLPVSAWDATGRLPAPRNGDTEATWAQRLGQLD